MNLRKLGKQLQREFKANPAKAGVLGLLLVVAIWFWGPLVLPASNSKPSRSSASPAASTPASVYVATNTPTTATTGGVFDWRRIAAALDADHLTSPLPVQQLALAHPQPFGDVDGEPQLEVNPQVEAEIASRLAPPIELPPDLPTKLGLRLTSVVVAARQSSATINGETYRLGDLVPTTPTPGSSELRRGLEAGEPLTLELLKVEPKRVWLKYANRTFQLPLDQGSGSRVRMQNVRSDP